jgi:hypothetical protein
MYFLPMEQSRCGACHLIHVQCTGDFIKNIVRVRVEQFMLSTFVLYGSVWQ